jgi:sulfatase modifying factor 1
MTHPIPCFSAALVLAAVACTSTPAKAPASAPASALPAPTVTAPSTGSEVRMIRFDGGRLHPAGHDEEVEVAPFLIDATEVTAGAFAACVRAGACPEPGGGGTCTYGVAGKENYPINCVSWNEAGTYAGWAGKRLPTEAEWEWAARGGPAARRFPWGDDLPVDQLCWSGRGNRAGAGQRVGPCPVGEFPAGNSPEGLEDMAGNVQEWTSTVFKVGARVCRGGSWFHEDFVDLLTSRRAYYSPGLRDNAIGFRCAKTP